MCILNNKKKVKMDTQAPQLPKAQTVMKKAPKFTKQQLSDHMFHMGTAVLECAIALNLSTDELKVFKSKHVGVYYIVGLESNEKGLPSTMYFKKDFR